MTAAKFAVIRQLIVLAAQLAAAATSAAAGAVATQAVPMIVKELAKAPFTTVANTPTQTVLKAIEAIAEDLMR